MSRMPISGIDYTTRDYEGFRTLMIQELKKRMPEYTDTRQSDAGIVILELNAMCLDILSYYLDSVANESFLVTAEQRSNIMKFCRMLGYTPRNATAAKYAQVFVKTNADEDVIIKTGTKVKTYSSNPDNQIYFTTTKDLHLPPGVLGNEQENGEYKYTVEVIHGLYVNNELLGYSNGGANQTYSLNYAPALINEDFKVYASSEAQESGRTWKRVNSFAGSDSNSDVYRVETNDYNESSVIFGDNVFGRIPVERLPITCSYYVGGGNVGNVGIGAIKELEDNLANVKSTFNVKVLEIGYDSETLDEIKINAPIAHRNIWGALTCDDFAGVLKVYFPDVKDAEAKKASEDWTKPEVDDIEIYVLTQFDIEEQQKYFDSNNNSKPGLFPPKYLNDSLYLNPSSEFYKPYKLLMGPESENGKIQAFFNSNSNYIEITEGSEQVDTARKLVGTRDIYLYPPNYVGLHIKCSLAVRDYYSYDDVANQVHEYLCNYFKLGNIKFNKDISLQELMYNIIDNSGIEGIRYLSFDVVNYEKDDNGEIHEETFSFINDDWLVPNVGTIFVLENLEFKQLSTSRKATYGGATVNA